MPPLDSIPPTAASVDEPKRRRISKRTLVAAALVPIAFASIAIAVTTFDGSSSKPNPKATATPASVSERLHKIHDAFPSGRNEKACATAFTANAPVPLVDFAALASFRRHEPANVPADEADLTTLPLTEESFGRLGEADHIAVVKRIAVVAPRASFGAPESGRYEGWLVVFDRNARPLCETRVIAWSSRYAMEPGISARVVREDFNERIKSGVRDGALRLSSSLVLDL